MLKYTLALMGLFILMGTLIPQLTLAEDEENPPLSESSEEMEEDGDDALSNMSIDPTNSLAEQFDEQEAPDPEEE